MQSLRVYQDEVPLFEVLVTSIMSELDICLVEDKHEVPNVRSHCFAPKFLLRTCFDVAWLLSCLEDDIHSLRAAESICYVLEYRIVIMLVLAEAECGCCSWIYHRCV